MPTIRNYGVGTGYNSNGITGRKSTFESDEKIYACHTWGNLNGSETLRISWAREESGQWVQKELHEWKNKGYSLAYQWAWIKNYPSGKWRVTFWCNANKGGTTNFTIKGNEEEEPPKPETYKVTIKSIPTKAVVYFGGVAMGHTPFTSPDLKGNYSMALKKTGYKDYIAKTISPNDAGKTLTFNLEPEPEPEYPKDITRGPYTISVDNETQETAAKEFLGIEPAGEDLDTWLSKRDLAGLEQWRDYWVERLGNLQMGVWVDFVKDKFDEYKDELPEEETLLEQFLNKILEGILIAGTFLRGLSHSNINTILENLLKLPDGEERIEEFGMKNWNEFVKEYPEFKVLSDSPRGSLSIAAVLGIATAVIGFGTLVNWLRKELPEPTGMAVWAAIEQENWEEANEANAKYRSFIGIANSWILQTLGWLNPFIKTFFDRNRDAQLASADTYQNLIDEHLAEKTGSLIIKPTPEDAKVSVEGQIPTTGTFSKLLPAGVYSVTVSKYGYTSKSGTIEVKEKETTEINVVLEEEPGAEEEPEEEKKGSLTISAIPGNAVIEIAGQPDIITSGTYELTPGNYSVKASAEGFISQTKNTYVNENKTTVLSFNLEEVEQPEDLPTKATIYITSEPTAADIYIDGAYQYVTTPFTTVLEAGTYVIRTQKDGYYPQEASVTCGTGDEFEVPFILEEIPATEAPSVTYSPYESYYPSYQPAVYYTPAIQPTPYSQVSLPNYSLLAAPTYQAGIEPSYAAVTEKEIMINIETTDLKPWAGRIFSIAWKDLTTPGAETQVIVDEDEKGLLETFMNEFNAGNYKTIIGYNLKFDYQWIFNKLMLYRIPAKKFYETDLRDVFQLMSQIKEEFVYNARAYGKLDEYGKELLGIGKYGDQETLMRRFTAGDISYVEAFQLRQIEITQGLYQLFNYCSSQQASEPIPSITSPGLSPETSLSTETPIQTGQKQCANCLAYNPITATQCEVCGSTTFK